MSCKKEDEVYLDSSAIEKNDCQQNESCKSVVDLAASVDLPVIVKPIVKTGKIQTKCDERPRVTINSCKCSDECCYTITLDIQLSVPIIIGANVEIGEPLINCKIPTAELGIDNTIIEIDDIEL